MTDAATSSSQPTPEEATPPLPPPAPLINVTMTTVGVTPRPHPDGSMVPLLHMSNGLVQAAIAPNPETCQAIIDALTPFTGSRLVTAKAVPDLPRMRNGHRSR